MKIIFATGNIHKLREAQEILGPDFELVSPASMGITEDIPETGETLKENSTLKADYIHSKTGLDCFADDTGLEVDALGGAPGVYSARYAVLLAMRDGITGDIPHSHSFDDNMNALLGELDKVPGAARTARFKSVITLITNGEHHFFEGTMEGRIAEKKAGCEGFGYDPVFISDLYPDRTVAELGESIKNEISHRSIALKKMAAYLKGNG